MTLLVGILCTDGVVVAADSAMTFGMGASFTIAHSARKIDIVSKAVIVAGTGQVGLGQRFKATVEKLWIDNKLKGDEHDRSRIMATAALTDFQGTGAPPGKFGALVASPMSGNRFSLCEFAVADFQPELKTAAKCCYVSMGSGQALADPFLAFMRDVFWKNGPPTLKGGKFAAAWVMSHAIKYAPGFVAEPIDVAVLDKNGASLLDENELQEHLAMVGESDEYLAGFPDRLQGKTTQPPTLPIMGDAASPAPSVTPPVPVTKT